MRRYLILLLLLLPPQAQAQVNPYLPQRPDPRQQRALREKAVAYIGATPVAREFIETYGEDATAAVLQCSPSVGAKLADFASQDLKKIPRPRELLRAIGQAGGDDAANWAMEHAAELSDIDNLAAFCRDPLVFALNLKPIAEAGAEMRAARLHYQAAATPQPPPQITINQNTAVIIGGVGIILLLWWWKKKRAGN